MPSGRVMALGGFVGGLIMSATAALGYWLCVYKVELARLEALVKKERDQRAIAETRLIQQSSGTDHHPSHIVYNSIGVVKSVYAGRNGTPSQPARGIP